MIPPLWKRSIRTRLTLWYSIFVALLFALLVAAMLLGQHLSSRDFFQQRLTDAVAEAADALRMGSDGPVIEGELSDEDVYVTVLDADGTLLIGRHRFGIAPSADRLRTSERRRGGTWYVLDHPVELDGNTYWIRCFMSNSAVSQTTRTLLLALIIAVPLMLLLTLCGGNLIAKRALRPLTEITATAESISGSGDLDRRIQLEDRTDEVGRLAQAFNSMFERLARSIDREKRFISDASHELRTPISVIAAQSEYALSPGASVEEKDAALKVIRERSERAGRMLNQMLLLSRMDSRRLPLHRERLSLSDLTEGTACELRDLAAARDMELSCDIAPGIEFDGDELLLTRMLTNLIQNAIQYGNPGGHIGVTLTRRGDRAVLTVRDDGPGIPEADQPKIWERFYQVHKDGESEGSGLGLPIVRWIAEAHGGSIQLESAQGRGSTFTVELPLAAH